MPATNVIQLRELLRERVPHARLGLPVKRRGQALPTGVASLDLLLGGGLAVAHAFERDALQEGDAGVAGEQAGPPVGGPGGRKRWRTIATAPRPCQMRQGDAARQKPSNFNGLRA